MLFASCKPLHRAENIKALYDAWDEDKAFVQMDQWRRHPEIASGRHRVLVADECPAESPGKVVLVGHGYAGCKLGGLDQPHPYLKKKDTDLLDYVIAASEEMVSLTAKMFGMDESRVLPLGKPRTDIYFADPKPDYFEGQRVYFYAPTYRTKEETPLPKIEWEQFNGNLTDDEILIVKPHMMNGKQLRRDYRRILEIPSSEPSTPYLLEADVLITDYSSIMFDAHLLNIPVVLFEKNPGYLDTRGMYLNYPYDYASRYCTDEASLLKTIRKADKPHELDIAARNRVVSACDGHSTERIIKFLKGLR